MSDTRLIEYMRVEVPKRIAQFKKESGPTLEDFIALGQDADLRGEGGDVDLTVADKVGLPQTLLDLLVKEVAIMAFTPGGVTILEHHYEEANDANNI